MDMVWFCPLLGGGCTTNMEWGRVCTGGHEGLGMESCWVRIDWGQGGDLGPRTWRHQGAGRMGKEQDQLGWGQLSIDNWTWRWWGRPAGEVRWEMEGAGKGVETEAQALAVGSPDNSWALSSGSPGLRDT